MWIEVPLMPLIYNMLQEALLINLQIMIHNLSILFNAQDSAARTYPAHDVLSTKKNKSRIYHNYSYYPYYSYPDLAPRNRFA